MSRCHTDCFADYTLNQVCQRLDKPMRVSLRLIVEENPDVNRSDDDAAGVTSKLLQELSSRANISSDRLSDVSMDGGSVRLTTFLV